MDSTYQFYIICIIQILRNNQAHIIPCCFSAFLPPVPAQIQAGVRRFHILILNEVLYIRTTGPEAYLNLRFVVENLILGRGLRAHSTETHSTFVLSADFDEVNTLQ